MLFFWGIRKARWPCLCVYTHTHGPLPQIEPSVWFWIRGVSALHVNFGFCATTSSANLLLLRAQAKAPHGWEQARAAKSQGMPWGQRQQCQAERTLLSKAVCTKDAANFLFSFGTLGYCVLFPVSSCSGACGYLGVHQLQSYSIKRLFLDMH